MPLELILKRTATKHNKNLEKKTQLKVRGTYNPKLSFRTSSQSTAMNNSITMNHNLKIRNAIFHWQQSINTKHPFNRVRKPVMNIKPVGSKPGAAFYQNKQKNQEHKQKWKLVVMNMTRMSRTEKGVHGNEISKD
uniref:Uncharacterized protein n=1 Tax=Salix viminalis TaxID=40686 RepID=A0A6N2N429_SALVM